MSMFVTIRVGLLLAVGSAIAISATDAKAAACVGEQNTTKHPRAGTALSECTDDATGASAFIAVAQYANDKPDGITILIEPGSAQDWTVYGYTFDADGRVVDGCTKIVHAPETFFREFIMEGCNQAATLLVYAEFDF
jgi:hypothetical protein